MMTSKLKCSHCGTELNRKKKFCNETCKNRYASNQRSQKKQEEILNKPHIRCVVCNSSFLPKKKNARFCNIECSRKYGNNKISQQKQEKRKENSEEYVSCLICGFLSNSIQNHIKHTHNLNNEEYLLKYPNGKIYSENYIKKLSENVRGENNPAYNHGGKYSPYSEKFIKYQNLPEEEKIKNIQELHERRQESITTNNNISTTISYWTSRGYSEKEAEEKLSERQKTFSLDICIKKYGEEEGRKRWIERQDKWLKTLNSKSDQEKMEINIKKMSSESCISKAEYEIVNYLKNNGIDVEHQYGLSNINFVYDIRFEDKIIEYNGDYWHCNPKKYDANYFNRKINMLAENKWKIDEYKRQKAEQQGFKVLIVWENDYKNNKEETLQKCLNFLKT